MADRDAGVRDALLGAADVAAIVDSRVWFSVLPPEPDIGAWMPAVVIQGQESEDEYTMGGPIDLGRGQIQVDAWTEGRAECETLRRAIRDALADLHDAALTVTGTLSDSPTYDPQAKLWRAVQFFDVWATS